MYRIAGNFRGSKLSRIRPKIIFMDLIFANFYYSAILYRIIYNFVNFIFANLKKLIAKRAKVISLKRFRLYSNQNDPLKWQLFIIDTVTKIIMIIIFLIVGYDRSTQSIALCYEEGRRCLHLFCCNV